MHQNSDKAYYLKNYSFQGWEQSEFSKKQSKPKSLFRNRRVEEIIKIYSSNRLKTENDATRQIIDDCPINIEIIGWYSAQKDKSNLFKKYKGLRLAMIKNKLWSNRKTRWHNFGHSEDLKLATNSLKPINTLSIKSLKPTSRYPHYVDAIHVADGLLLEKPIRDIDNTAFANFFMRHKTHKIAVSKRESHRKDDFAKQKQKWLNRKKWI